MTPYGTSGRDALGMRVDTRPDRTQQQIAADLEFVRVGRARRAAEATARLLHERVSEQVEDAVVDALGAHAVGEGDPRDLFAGNQHHDAASSEADVA